MYVSLLLLQLLFAIAIHGIRPIVSLFAYSEGASALIIGLLVTSYAFLPMLTAIKVGKWLDIYGAKKMLAIGASLTGCALFIPIMVSNIVGLFISQFIFGFAFICVNVSVQKTIGNMDGSRDKHIATLSFMGSTGGLIGPLITGFVYEHLGIRLVYAILLFFVAISGVLLVVIRSKEWPTLTISKKVKKSPSWHMLKEVSLRNALIISGITVYSKELFTAYFPVLATNNGITAGTIGLLLAVSAGASMTVRFFQFHLVEKFGRTTVLLVSVLMSGLGYMSIPFFSDPIILVALVILVGGGLGLGQPISLVQALNTAPQGRSGEVLGLRITFNRGAQVIAPLLFGVIGSLAGVAPIFWISGAMLFAGTYFTKAAKGTRAESEEE